MRRRFPIAGCLLVCRVLWPTGAAAALAGGAAADAPVLTFESPRSGAAFVPADAALIFEARDDQALPFGQHIILLNGAPPAGGFLAFGNFEDGKRRRWELSSALRPNQDYVLEVTVTDAEGNRTSGAIYFDTFDPASVSIEAEDYNFGGGKFFDSPRLTPEGVFDPDGYQRQAGVAGVDFWDARSETSPPVSRYRPDDPVATERSPDFAREKFLLLGGAEGNVFDYVVQDLRAGEWRNYTRTFPAGAYELRLRQRVGASAPAVAALEQVISAADASVPETLPLGVFLAATTSSRFQTVPLTDATGGRTVLVRLSGEERLRLSQLTDDPAGTGVEQNFLVAIPVAELRPLRPVVTAVAPWPGQTVSPTGLTIEATIVDRDTQVVLESVRLAVDGALVNAAARRTGELTRVTFRPVSLTATESEHRVELHFADTAGEVSQARWTFRTAGGAALQLESATEVQGPYSVQPGAVFDLEAQSVGVPAAGQRRFYRLRATGLASAPRLGSIQLAGTQVLIRYQWE